MEALSIQPYFVEKPWGGLYISQFFQLPQLRKIGEALLVSTLKDQENIVGSQKLSEFSGGSLPYVIKLIDADENLSIQVHPNDYFADKLESSVGKTECWLIADSKEGSGIYYGLKDGVSLEQFYKCVEKNENVPSLLNFVEVKRGDFIVVPAGTIHAIGAGVRLVEFQQSSGITYRIWDWGREGRELHIEKSLIVSNENQKAPSIIGFSEIDLGECFFKHTDFKLHKQSENMILCSSDRSPIEIKFDCSDFTFSLGKTE